MRNTDWFLGRNLRSAGDWVTSVAISAGSTFLWHTQTDAAVKRGTENFPEIGGGQPAFFSEEFRIRHEDEA